MGNRGTDPAESLNTACGLFDSLVGANARTLALKCIISERI